VFGPADNMLAALAQSTIGKALALTGDHEGALRAYEARWRFFRSYVDGKPDARAIDSAEVVAAGCCEVGRWAEAEEWLALYEDVPRRTPDRLASEARVASYRGDHETALQLARRAVDSPSDALNDRAARWLALADVHRAAGNDQEAGAAAAEAIALYREKGNVAAVAAAGALAIT
jgi:tetratricopeptide (TPR) repeat protein